jgi:hypothetical protein
LAGAADLTSTNQRILRIDPLLLTPSLQILPQLEMGFNDGPIGSSPDCSTGRFATKNRIDRVEDNRLPGSGFPGQHIQTRPKIQFQVIDQGKIFDAERQ